jgi:hypothetical protein
LYPNPARDAITVEGNWGEWIWITDVLGRKRRFPVEKTGKVALRVLPPGMYRASPEPEENKESGAWFCKP